MYVQALDCVGRGSGVGCVSKGKYVLRLEVRLQSRDVDNPEMYVDDLERRTAKFVTVKSTDESRPGEKDFCN
jgi:hypothetical protein